MKTYDGPGRDARPDIAPTPRSRVWHRAAAASAVAAISVGALGILSPTAGAATAPIPVFPDNLVVFPDRDFVSIEGYSEYGGQTALIEVNRPGVGIVGSAEGVVTGTDVAFEVNHPGGYCWGAGTGVNVTPDIIPGDEVTISIGGVALNTTTVLDVQASDAELQPDGVTMLVRGHIGDGVTPDQMEQRIIEPALVDTPIGKRDIRAVLGDLQPGPNGAYSSKLEVDEAANTFVATYLFDDPTVATIAANAGLGERAMAWQLVDGAANRQGLTIAEFGDTGGPGMGGCPNGPLQSGPPAPNKITAVPQSGGAAIRVDWQIPSVIPGTQPIVGYRVRAVDLNTQNGGTIHKEFGRRIDDPTATGITIDGLDPSRDYDIEVASISSVGETYPAATAHPAQDATAPVITPSINGGSFPTAQSLTLAANEPGVQIFFTISTDGSTPADPIDNAGGADPTATIVTGPIPITQSAIVKVGGFDPTGNPSVVQTLTFTITNDPTAAKTAITSATAGVGQVGLTWNAADPVAVGASIVKYVVTAYDQASGGSAKATAEFAGTALAGVVGGLDPNKDLWFTVAAVNSINPTAGPESDRFGPVAPKGPVIANAGPDQANVVRNTTVSLSGAGSTTGAGVTYRWAQLTSPTGLEIVDPANPLKVTINNADRLGASFLLPLYTYRMLDSVTKAPSKLYFQLRVTDTSTGESITDTVTITPRGDTVAIASARFRASEFRITGTGAIEGAIVTVRGVNPATGVMTTYGRVIVVAGAWDLRLRNGQVPVNPPTSVFADSNQGATAGPTAVAR
ncbi:MAG: fibronectin type III domain-containing protein [Ilumatobacteraceae bacterium]